MNRIISHPDHHHNLLGHAWLLWNEGKALERMDECFKNSCLESKVLRCIQVGLLCIQKISKDRPTINSLVLMLANEVPKLPKPKQPSFFIEGSSNNVNEGSMSRNEEAFLENQVTITLDGR